MNEQALPGLAEAFCGEARTLAKGGAQLARRKMADPSYTWGSGYKRNEAHTAVFARAELREIVV